MKLLVIPMTLFVAILHLATFSSGEFIPVATVILIYTGTVWQYVHAGYTTIWLLFLVVAISFRVSIYAWSNRGLFVL